MLSCLYEGKVIHAENTRVNLDGYKCITCAKPVILKISNRHLSYFAHKANKVCVHEDPVLKAITVLEKSYAQNLGKAENQRLSDYYSCDTVDGYLFDYTRHFDNYFITGHFPNDINQDNLRRLISIGFALLKEEIKVHQV